MSTSSTRKTNYISLNEVIDLAKETYDLKEKGYSFNAIAKMIDYNKETVSKYYKMYKQGGAQAIADYYLTRNKRGNKTKANVKKPESEIKSRLESLWDLAIFGRFDSVAQ